MRIRAVHHDPVGHAPAGLGWVKLGLVCGAVLAAGCSCGGDGSDDVLRIGDARPGGPADAAVDAAIDRGPAVGVVWRTFVPDMPWGANDIAALGDGVALVGDVFVAVSSDGVETARYTIPVEEGPFHRGYGIGDELLAYIPKESGTTPRTSYIRRFDSDLNVVGEYRSPNGTASREVWAPGPQSSWYLGMTGSEYDVDIGELPYTGEPRAWTYDDWTFDVLPEAGMVTSDAVPVFFAVCGDTSLAWLCALRVDPATGELTSANIAPVAAVGLSWMAETSQGVLIFYVQRNSTPMDPQAPLSCHAILIDPDDLSVLKGPVKMSDALPDEKVAPLDMVVLNDRAYVPYGRSLFAFDANTLEPWTRNHLTNFDSYPAGLAISGGELYHYAIYTPSPGTVLVQKLIPP